MKNILKGSLTAAIFCAVLVACSHAPPSDLSPPTAELYPETIDSAITSSGPIESITPLMVPEREIELVAKALRGECYDDQPDDKREVARVICNRVCDGRFGDDVESVVTAPRQFAGYRPDNVPTVNDYEIAREVLTEWYAGGCQPLSKYLFFSSGGGHVNVFREDFETED